MVNHKGFFYVQVMDERRHKCRQLRKEVKKKDKAGCL
jgi:hypothetical protein